jgi:hypothetical protein
MDHLSDLPGSMCRHLHREPVDPGSEDTRRQMGNRTHCESGFASGDMDCDR